MFTITFNFSGKETKEYQHITKVKYFNVVSDTEVVGDDIFTHDFPLSADMQLFSENKTYKISSNGLKSIEVEKEL